MILKKIKYNEDTIPKGAHKFAHYIQSIAKGQIESYRAEGVD